MSGATTDPKDVRRLVVSMNYAVKDEAGLREVIAKFGAHGFRQLDAKLSPEQLGLLTPSAVLSQIRAAYPNLERVVLLSNLRVLMLAWYRVFNGLFDEFVWFLDPDSVADRVDSPDPVVQALGSFNGIDTETLEGRIFTNANGRNCHSLSLTMMAGQNVRRFATLSEFPWDETSKGQAINKMYVLAGKPYEMRADETSTELERVELDLPLTEEPMRHAEFVKAAGPGIAFIILGLLETPLAHRLELVAHLFDGSERWLPEETTASLADPLVEYIEAHAVDFPTRMLLLARGALLSRKAVVVQELYRQIASAPAEDDRHSAFLYAAWLERSHSPSSESDSQKREIYGDIVAAYREQPLAGSGRPVHRYPGRIAVLLGSFDDPGRAAMEPLITCLVALAARGRERQLMVFVADTFLATPTAERNCLGPRDAFESQVFAPEHRNALTPAKIGVMYVDREDDRRERYDHLSAAIRTFDPEVVWCHDCEFEVLRALLNQDYPMVSSRSSGPEGPDPAEARFDHLPSVDELDRALAHASENWTA